MIVSYISFSNGLTKEFERGAFVGGALIYAIATTRKKPMRQSWDQP
jgi:hypothetical protein